MSERLGALYHWSPKARREAVRSEGLKPYTPPVVRTEFDDAWAHGYGCICLGPTPSGAWGLSGGMQHQADVEGWDLWQVRLEDEDEVHIRAEFGDRIREVRVFNPIAADRLWWVGERD